LREDPQILAEFVAFFARRNRPMPPRTAVQALVPEGAVFSQTSRHRPGAAVCAEPEPVPRGGRPAWLVMLPGPPRELRPMFHRTFCHGSRNGVPLPVPCACRTLRTVGIGESQVEQLIDGPLRGFTDRGSSSVIARGPGEVDVRLFARGSERTG
jgi:nicotinamide-nucleotide amidase